MIKLPNPYHPEAPCRECGSVGFHKMDCSKNFVHPLGCKCPQCKGKLVRDAKNRTLVVHYCRHGEVRVMCGMCRREREYYERRNS